jgi:hypothetical protein
MIALKEAHCKQAPKITRPAYSRALAPSGCQFWQVAEAELYTEHLLWERVQEICLEYGQTYASQVSIGDCQALPPEAVSIAAPPEYAWYVRLHLEEQAFDETRGEMAVIAFVRDATVGLMPH